MAKCPPAYLLNCKSVKVSKKRKIANEKVDAEKLYSLEEASALIKEITKVKFDASVDIHARLQDPRDGFSPVPVGSLVEHRDFNNEG